MTLQRTMKLYRLPDVSRNNLQFFKTVMTETFNVEKNYLQESKKLAYVSEDMNR